MYAASDSDERLRSFSAQALALCAHITRRTTAKLNEVHGVQVVQCERKCYRRGPQHSVCASALYLQACAVELGHAPLEFLDAYTPNGHRKDTGAQGLRLGVGGIRQKLSLAPAAGLQVL